MFDVIATIKIILGTLIVVYLMYFVKDLLLYKSKVNSKKVITASGISVITNFLDTLGIGSFATTTLGFKITNFLESDKLLPGTLIVGFAAPSVLQALLFLGSVEVNTVTLVSMAVASIVGGAMGAKVVSKLPEKKIQIVMSIALFATAVMMTLKQSGALNALGEGNTANGFKGITLIIAVIGNFILGALTAAGIGLFAPCMAMIYMLGLSLPAAFPIMMTSSAALVPPTAIQFIKSDSYSRSGALGLAIGSIPGVFIAYKLFEKLKSQMTILIWIVILVIIYASIMMLMSGIKKPKSKMVK
ncbi:MAG: sulfite exporter TauE/SafE family protein [Candidatus Paraimprobicoccus trichonymphae]|uniref:Sulfite exporter TauE/SafE family protein n=1 Tax=Candidatus Paraimprobicoccus trichonymphae TaxID=3033793 RepID=A0AA48IHE1_9FIRM|nr:MAG: sulfite exporter TauE/SafE family protein [Candidatus Paraimprobicoccus trichonymphae]